MLSRSYAITGCLVILIFAEAVFIAQGFIQPPCWACPEHWHGSCNILCVEGLRPA